MSFSTIDGYSRKINSSVHPKIESTDGAKYAQIFEQTHNKKVSSSSVRENFADFANFVDDLISSIKKRVMKFFGHSDISEDELLQQAEQFNEMVKELEGCFLFNIKGVNSLDSKKATEIFNSYQKDLTHSVVRKVFGNLKDDFSNQKVAVTQKKTNLSTAKDSVESQVSPIREGKNSEKMRENGEKEFKKMIGQIANMDEKQDIMGILNEYEQVFITNPDPKMKKVITNIKQAAGIPGLALSQKKQIIANLADTYILSPIG